MSSVYAKFIAESAYKHTVDKPHTGNGIAFYEEPGRIAHRVDLDAIWTDSKYIPINAPDVEDDGFYYVNVGSSRLKILQKLENIALDKVDGTNATYKSVYLIDSIFPSYGTGYSITLTDWNGEVIPFGLNQWVIDPDNGEITFLGGWPEGYLENPKISFYRYVGRKAEESFLRSDGSVQMIDTYNPTQDQDIATKKYVDAMTGDISNIVEKLIPEIPPTLDNADLSLEYERDIYASPWNSEVKMPVVFFGEDYKIHIPQFYNPGRGTFHINVNGFDIVDVDLNKVGGPSIYDYWTVTSVVDPYRTSKVASKFYKSINSYITLPEDAIKSLISVDEPFITLYCYTYYDFIKISSNPITIGFENKIERPYIGTYRISQLKYGTNSESPIKYVSGVPTLKKDASFNYGFNLKDVALFKNDFSGKLSINDFYDELLLSDKVYNELYPTQFIDRKIIIPENISCELFKVAIIGNNVALEDNIRSDKVYNIRIDTISNESDRKISPYNFNDIDYTAEDWTDITAEESLEKTFELQMLNGKYQWPSGNYTNNGNFTELNLTDTISIDIPSGPDYSNLENSTRYVTFSYDMPFCNGFWISLEDSENVISDRDTHAFSNIAQFRCIVEHETGWLNMSTPYEGVLLPRENNDGCLVVQSSDTNTKYITFGNEPLAGKLDITIGINKDSGIKFSGIKIVFNV